MGAALASMPPARGWESNFFSATRSKVSSILAAHAHVRHEFYSGVRDVIRRQGRRAQQVCKERHAQTERVMYGVEENSMGIAHPRTPRAFYARYDASPHNVSQRLNSMRLQRIRFDVVSGCRFYGLTRCATAPVPAQQQFVRCGSIGHRRRWRASSRLPFGRGWILRKCDCGHIVFPI